MPLTRRAYQKLVLHNNIPQNEIKTGKLKSSSSSASSKVASTKTRHSKEPTVESIPASRKHPQTALRSRENEPHKSKPDISDNHLGSSDCVYHTRFADTDQGSVSGICLSKECSSGKQTKKTSKTFASKKRKRLSKSTKVVKPKEKVLARIQSEVKSVRDESVISSSPSKKQRKCTHEVLDTPKCCSDEVIIQVLTSRHQEIKAKISLVRQHLSGEQTKVEKLREQLARDKHKARASLGYRRIRIQREVQKVRDRVQSQDKKRLKLEDVRIQRELEASKRKVDSDSIAMKIQIWRNWRDRFGQKTLQVRNAKRNLKEQSRSYEAKKGAMKKQLQKSWTALQNKVQEMRDRIETEMVKHGQQWDGVSWTNSIAGKHKYSLRRAPREKTHIYCRAWKMTNKKETKTPSVSGATVYKEAKQNTFTELYQLLDSELRCSICSELFVSAVVLNCSHTFCSYCITQWKRRTNWCPICRTSITARNPIAKLDSFINKFTRRVGPDIEKKRMETIKDRERHEKELQQDGRSWGNFANHSLDDFDDDDLEDDDFLNGSLSSDDSDFVNFIEILQDRAAHFRRYFGMDEDDDDDSFGSSMDSDETDDGLELFSDSGDDDFDDLDDDDDEDEREGIVLW